MWLFQHTCQFVVVTLLLRRQPFILVAQPLPCFEGLLSLGLCLAYLADRVLHRAVGIVEDLPCLGPGTCQNIVAFVLQATVKLLILGDNLSQKAVGHLHLGLFLGQRFLVRLQLLQLLLEIEHRLSYPSRCAVEQCLWKTHIAGNLESKRAAWQSHP